MRWLAFLFVVFVWGSLVLPCRGVPQSPSPSPTAFATKYLEQIPLRYADPRLVARTLNTHALPTGVLRVQADPKLRRTLRVLGTQEGIATVKSIVSLLDVAPRMTTLKLTIERVQFGPGGTKTTTTAARKTVTVTHNVKTGFVVTDASGATLSVSLTARLPQSRDTPPTLLTAFGWRQVRGSVGLERAVPLPTELVPKRVVGLTFEDDPVIVAAVGVGNIPVKWSGTFTAYYLSVQPTSELK